MGVPSESYLEAMETEQYQRAATDEEMLEHWEDDGDPLAKAFLSIAEAHRDAAIGDRGGAKAALDSARRHLADVREGGWTVKALEQHVQQAGEYLSAGRPLPDLPAGL